MPVKIMQETVFAVASKSVFIPVSTANQMRISKVS